MSKALFTHAEKLTTGATVSISLYSDPEKGSYWVLENQNSHARREFHKPKEIYEYLEHVLDIDQDEAEAEDAVEAYRCADLTDAWERCLENPTPENESELLRIAVETGLRRRVRQEATE